VGGGPRFGAGEQRILQVQGDRSDAALDYIGVDLYLTLANKPGESFPAGERVADRLG
jgi:hypothetical protein